MRFSGMTESFWSDVVSQNKTKPWLETGRLPLAGPEPR